jgi:hypothetical protein
MGAMPPTAAMTFSTRTSRTPVARSTMIARQMTIAHPPANPWTSRAAGTWWVQLVSRRGQDAQ